MRAALWVLALFALAVAVTLVARVDQGYVIIVYPPWRVEMSFMLALSLMLALFVFVHLGLAVLRLTLRLPGDVQNWRERRRKRKAEDELSRAQAALISGQPAHARQLADKALKREHLPLAALVAAKAAAESGDAAASRRYLGSVSGDVGELIAARQAIERQLIGSNPRAGVLPAADRVGG